MQRPISTSGRILLIFLLMPLVRCGEGNLAPTGEGSIQVAASTTGTDPDPNGYSLALDGTQSLPIPTNGAATFTEVTSGEHQLELSEIAPNCTVNDANPRTVLVSADAGATVTFAVTCTGSSTIQVTVMTNGSDPDPDGFTVTLETESRALATNGTVLFSELVSGVHCIVLSGVAANCTVTGENPRVVTVDIGATISTEFAVECTSLVPFRGRIVFASNRDDPFDTDVYIMNADGSSARNLTQDGINPANDMQPAWSPDESQIAFASEREGEAGLFDIYIMDAFNAIADNFTNSPANEVNPSWSPDSTHIAFERYPAAGGTSDILVRGFFDPDPVNITPGPEDGMDPVWSPDGIRIAFVTSRQGGALDLFVMNADGSSPVNLTPGPDGGFDPAWSPDGSRIAFTTVRDGNEEIYVMAADGSNSVNLSTHPARDFGATWAPDGTRIAFSTDRDSGNLEIYAMHPDGSNPINLTRNPRDDVDPHWGP